MQEAEEEAEEEALSPSTQPLLAFWSPSSLVTVVLRGRVNTSPPEAATEKRASRPTGCSMKWVGFFTKTQKRTVLYKHRYSLELDVVC